VRVFLGQAAHQPVDTGVGGADGVRPADGQGPRGEQGPAQLLSGVVAGYQCLDEPEELQHAHVLSCEGLFIQHRGLGWLGGDPDDVVHGPQRVQLRGDPGDVVPGLQAVGPRVQPADRLLLLATAADDQHTRARFGPDRPLCRHDRAPDGCEEDVADRTSSGHPLGLQSPGGEFP
jgi:hypothetical protein